ncbi:uncharacterized protein LOC26535598 [Drosophila yakuba]|uniref:Uncharacterized protein n=1 Tax=Drosophila yakuba TaxID=7245 RepID=A0A0R1E1V1_DROYA|nr:uncharacterized protein LOC26535598 [Drosophila yakuba]KRK03109.1 uncharacterized protein Dyak_GE29257 [Drosophila yakuba]
MKIFLDLSDPFKCTSRINHVLWTLWIVLWTLRILLLSLWTLLWTLWTTLWSVWILLWTLWTLLRTIWQLLRRLLVLSAPYLQPNRFVASFHNHTMVKLTPNSFKSQKIY